MTDDVHISGSDLNWATEKTQAELLESIKKALKLDQQNSNKLNKALSEAAKNGGFVGKESKKLFGEFTTGLKKSTHGALDSAAGFDKLKGPMKGFREQLKEMNLSTKIAAASAVSIGIILGEVWGHYRASIDVIRAMNDVGVLYNETHIDISRILAETGMNMEEFSNLTQNYTRIIAQNGISSIRNLVDRVDSLSGGFETLGLTTAEGTEFVADYLERQRMLGVFTTATQRDLNQAIRGNIERLTAYSKVLNVSRKDLIQQSKEAMSREDVRRRFFALERDQRQAAVEAFDQSIAAFGVFGEEGTELGKKFTDMVARLNPETSELLQGLRAAGAPEIASRIVEWSRNIERGIPVTAEQVQNLQSMLEANKDVFNQLGQSKSQYASVADALGSLGLRLQEASEAGGEMTSKVNDNIVGLTSMEDGLNKTLQSALNLATDTINDLVILISGKSGEAGMAGAMKMFGNGLEGVADTLNKMADMTPGEMVSATASAVWDGIKGGFASVMNAAANKISNAVDRVTAAVYSLNPFGPDAPRPMELGTPTQQAYIKVSDTATQLEAERARLNQLQSTPSGGRHGVIGLESMIEKQEKTIGLLQAQLIEQMKTYKQLVKNTRATEENGG